MSKLRNTNLTVTITGVSADEEGLLRTVNARYDHVRALYLGALRMEDDDGKLHEAIVGAFPERMWADLMLRMLNCAQLHGEKALDAMKIAINEFLDAFEKADN